MSKPKVPKHAPAAESKRPVSSGTKGSAKANPTAGLTFDEFQDLIRERYFETDNARGAAGTFLLLMEEVGELATALHDNRPPRSRMHPMGKKRPIHKDERANLEEEFADVLAWLTTIANIHGVRLQAALEKYTNVGRVKGIKD